MRKRILSIISFIAAIACLLPVCVSATGGFVTIKGTTMYHNSYCDFVEDCKIEDLEWFETQAQALQAGYEPCDQCDASSGYSYTPDGDTYWNSSDTKIQNALETERLMGILEGYDAGKEYGYEEGYAAGEEVGYGFGYDNGRDDGRDAVRTELEDEYRQSLHDAKSQAYISAIITAAIIGIPALFILTANRVKEETDRLESTHKTERDKLAQTIRCLESNLNSRQSFSSAKVQNDVGVDRFGFNEGGLYVKFTNGKVHMYYVVKESVYQEMRNASSINDFFHDRINGIYSFIPMN